MGGDGGLVVFSFTGTHIWQVKCWVSKHARGLYGTYLWRWAFRFPCHLADILDLLLLGFFHFIDGVLQVLLKPLGLRVNAHLLVVLQFGNDLEGAVGCVEELELANASLWDCVDCGAAPASLYQADGLGTGNRCMNDDRHQSDYYDHFEIHVCSVKKRSALCRIQEQLWQQQLRLGVKFAHRLRSKHPRQSPTSLTFIFQLFICILRLVFHCCGFLYFRKCSRRTHQIIPRQSRGLRLLAFSNAKISFCIGWNNLVYWYNTDS